MEIAGVFDADNRIRILTRRGQASPGDGLGLQAMPYTSNEALPLSIRNQLPPQALDIYREAFSYAYRYGHADEATAHRIAWAAVKRTFEKADGAWVRRVGR